MKKAIIFGSSEMAEQVYLSNLENKGPFDIVAFSTDRNFIKKSDFYGVPVIPFDVIREYYPPMEIEGLILCLGYKNMNLNRMEIFNRLTKISNVDKSYKILNYIDRKAVLRSGSIGTGNVILGGCHIGFNCIIGNANVFAYNCMIGHDSEVGSFNYFAGGSLVGGKNKIGNRCFFGVRSVAANGITISNRTLLGAGCYLSRDSEEGSTYSPEKVRKVILSEDYQGMLLK